ncbi:hypothetical protein LWI28_001717 [Acer negundo]|uniref:Uncharacterized protein n=1 Tax=Acer negundo TaxID=4023 RepID=A0AAD5IF29_ACENE|nr:hypothetical protein LWI28_001717 [Acer negundo]
MASLIEKTFKGCKYKDIALADSAVSRSIQPKLNCLISWPAVLIIISPPKTTWPPPSLMTPPPSSPGRAKPCGSTGGV